MASAHVSFLGLKAVGQLQAEHSDAAVLVPENECRFVTCVCPTSSCSGCPTGLTPMAAESQCCWNWPGCSLGSTPTEGPMLGKELPCLGLNVYN